MKKQLLLITMLTMLAPAFCQSFTETDIGSGTIQGSSVIVRNYNDTVVVMYNYDYNLTDGENRFTVRKSTSNSISFKLPDVYTSGGTPFPTPPIINSGKILYRIHDMEILNDTCYFCGEKKETTGDYYYDTNGLATYLTNDVGLVGKFTITKLLNGICDLELTTIPRVSSLRRMAVYESSQGYSISMIGVPRARSSPTCIVDLYNEISIGSWVFDLAHPLNYQELLFDITYAGGTVITVSGLVYEGHSFIIRQTKASWILIDPTTCIHFPYVFHTDMAFILSNPSILPTKKDYLSPLFLCPESRNASSYYVAHECIPPHNGIAAYKMKVDNFCTPPINQANQFAMGPPSGLILNDMVSNMTTNTLFLLTKDRTSNTTDIQLLSFANTTDYSDYQYSQTDHNIQSLDLINSTQLLYGGSQSPSSNIFQTIATYHHFSPPFSPYSSPCRLFNGVPIFILDSLRLELIGEGLIIDYIQEKTSWDPCNCPIKWHSNATTCRF